MRRTDKKHKDAWLGYVVTKLGFGDCPPEDMTKRLVALYEQGWTTEEAIAYINKLFSIPDYTEEK